MTARRMLPSDCYDVSFLRIIFMKNFYNIKLDNRLYLCAKKVRQEKSIVDIGADHAYLAIWLVLNKLVRHAIATDIRKGPLLNSVHNIKKFGLEDKIEARRSDGLDEINPYEVDDIIIAGMGGELIAQIISRADWLKEKSKHLILQPMSSESELREFLNREHFKIDSEQAIIDNNKVYTVMSVFFEETFYNFDKLYPYIGRLGDNLTFENYSYIKKVIKDLKNKLKGYVLTKQLKKSSDISEIILELEKIIKENER